jgi:hypothetical protein
MMARSQTGLLRIAAISATLLLAVSMAACVSGPSVNENFTDAELAVAMDEAMADAAATLPDFPGFSGRTIDVNGCHYGMHEEHASAGHDTVVMHYGFAEELWDDPLLRETYPALIAEYWRDAGYEVEENASATGKYTSVTATREDGLIIVYRVAAIVVMEAFLGGGICVPMDDELIGLAAGSTGIEPEDTGVNDHLDRVETQ